MGVKRKICDKCGLQNGDEIVDESSLENHLYICTHRRREKPSFLQIPFTGFRGLTRDNTVIGTPGLPYAWGYTYKTPYRHGYVKTRSDFNTQKFEFDYMASTILRGIRQVKHGVSMMKFLTFDRQQLSIGYKWD